MRIDWTRALRAVGLVAWAAFFDYLWLSGRSVDYVGPRTTWVVTFGAIALTAASVLYVSGLFVRQQTSPPTGRELGRLLVILAPIMLAFAAPSATLGAQAVEQKRAADGATSLARLEGYDGSIRLYDLAAASYSPQFAAERGVAEGVQVSVDGFVSKTPGDGTIELSRFLASCCAADAMPYSVDVVLPSGNSGFEKNQWLQVSGQVEQVPRGRRTAFRLVAKQVEPIDRPADAYG